MKNEAIKPNRTKFNNKKNKKEKKKIKTFFFFEIKTLYFKSQN